MVVLKTKSQLNNFVKRKRESRNYFNNPGCGCCFSGGQVQIDEERKRVIFHEWSEGLSESSSCTVLATFKKIR